MNTDPARLESLFEKKIYRGANVSPLEPTEAQDVPSGAPVSPEVEDQHVKTGFDIRPGDVRVGTVPAMGIKTVDEHDCPIS